MAAKKQGWIHKKLKLSQHRHTGRVLAHQHTSHGALMAIVLAAGIILVFATQGLVASADTQTGDINFSGKVYQLPPSQKAVILYPAFGQIFTTNPITVSGTCQPNDFVQIYRNHKAVDSAACIRGQFGVLIDLVPGKNNLVIRTLDNLFQFGPNSDAVNVYYNPVYIVPSVPQLLITPNANQFGYSVGQPYELKLTIAGGVAPYATNIRWGDGLQDIIPTAQVGEFSVTHKYNRPGQFDVIINATDSKQQKAYAQTSVLVGGPSGASLTQSGINQLPKSLVDVVWPVYLITAVAVTLFWLGERYELAWLQKRGLIRKKV